MPINRKSFSAVEHKGGGLTHNTLAREILP